ncbi:CPBP family intramembrane glutamic endopeptidase [Haloarculaceae archaeon H-GB11]|nr:CPBP family intramembrane glutamic endopeptidase [Haloarculaceae archaeon H-GB11]
MASDYVRVADTETRLVSVVHAVAVVVAAFLMGGLVLAFVADAALGAAGIGRDSTVYYVTLFAAQFTGFGVVVVGYLALRDQWDLFEVSVPSLKDLAWVVAGFLGILGTAAGIGWVVSQLGTQTAQNEVVEIGQTNPDLYLYMIPIALLFVGPAEELVFRGVVQGLLRRAYGVVPAVLATSVFFGVAHIFALTGSGKVTYMAIAAAMGLILGALYERTENIVVPALVHGGWNAFLFLGLWATSAASV